MKFFDQILWSCFCDVYVQDSCTFINHGAMGAVLKEAMEVAQVFIRYSLCGGGTKHQSNSINADVVYW